MDGLVPSFWAKLPNKSKVNDLAPILSNFCAKLPKLSIWTPYMYRDWHPSEQHQRLVRVLILSS